jgi:hypothetical protein
MIVPIMALVDVWDPTRPNGEAGTQLPRKVYAIYPLRDGCSAWAGTHGTRRSEYGMEVMPLSTG